MPLVNDSGAELTTGSGAVVEPDANGACPGCCGSQVCRYFYYRGCEPDDMCPGPVAEIYVSECHPCQGGGTVSGRSIIYEGRCYDRHLTCYHLPSEPIPGCDPIPEGARIALPDVPMICVDHPLCGEGVGLDPRCSLGRMFIVGVSCNGGPPYYVCAGAVYSCHMRGRDIEGVRYCYAIRPGTDLISEEDIPPGSWLDFQPQTDQYSHSCCECFAHHDGSPCPSSIRDQSGDHECDPVGTPPPEPQRCCCRQDAIAQMTAYEFEYIGSYPGNAFDVTAVLVSAEPCPIGGSAQFTYRERVDNNGDIFVHDVVSTYFWSCGHFSIPDGLQFPAPIPPGPFPCPSVTDVGGPPASDRITVHGRSYTSSCYGLEASGSASIVGLGHPGSLLTSARYAIRVQGLDSPACTNGCGLDPESPEVRQRAHVPTPGDPWSYL